MEKGIGLKGWSFKGWFLGNWSTIKEGIKIGLPLIIGWVTTHNVVAAGVIGICGKFALDLGHFYFKTYSK